MMSQDDLNEIVATGERLPEQMFDPGLLPDEERLDLPVFDGEKIVDQAKD